MDRMFVAIVFAATVVLGGCGKGKDEVNVDVASELPASPTTPAQAEPATTPGTRNEKEQSSMVKLETNKGNIVVRLYDKEAPKHSANFVKLVKEGFYDGIVWHRVVPGFVIQAGDPITKKDPNDPQVGTGGPGYKIPAEIGMKHTRGVLAMARQGDEVNPKRESSGSQFYVCLNTEAVTQLDGGYSAFGEVTEGMGVVDKIRQGDIIKKATVLKEAAGTKPEDEKKGEQ